MSKSPVIIIPGNPEEVMRQLRQYFSPRDDVKGIENVFLVIQDESKDLTKVIPSRNIVTNDGDQWYAQAACTEATHFTVAGMRLGTNAGGGTAKGSTDVNTFFGVGKALEAGYPKSNDPDSSNPGALIDAASWKSVWGTGDNNGSAMDEGAIVDNLTVPTKAISHFTFAAHTKVATETLAVYVNHEMRGV